MRKTTPGIDRIETTATRAIVTLLQREIDRHPKLCHQCHHAGQDVYSHCDEWWEMARRLHGARRLLAALESPAVNGELTLFGPGEL